MTVCGEEKCHILKQRQVRVAALVAFKFGPSFLATERDPVNDFCHIVREKKGYQFSGESETFLNN